MTQVLTSNPVKTGVSHHADEVQAVEELARQISQAEIEHVLFFCSARYDLDRLADALNRVFPGLASGCTTAGEIGPGGYSSGGLVGMSIGPGPIRVHRYAIPNVTAFDHGRLKAIRSDFEANRRYPGAPPGESLGILLVDGLCLKEENLVAALHGQFQPMDISGGSAGDDFALKQTLVYCDGRFAGNSAAFMVCEMGGVPFRPFRLQDFKPITDYMVITGADPEDRLVKEIDCEPALDIYSKVIGVPASQISLETCASYSLMVSIGGQDYIRSVKRCMADGSLSLYSAIDEGLVVRICRSDDTLASLSEMFQLGGALARTAKFVICFDCIHRRVQLQRQGMIGRAGELLTQLPVVGFTTYGEICDSIHVNQTMTGVIVGADGSEE